MNEEIKPCPSCGNHLAKARNGMHDFGNGFAWWFACEDKSCSASGPVSELRAGALEKWNKMPRRNDPTSFTPEVVAMLVEVSATDRHVESALQLHQSMLGTTGHGLPSDPETRGAEGGPYRVMVAELQRLGILPK